LNEGWDWEGTEGRKGYLLLQEVVAAGLASSGGSRVGVLLACEGPQKNANQGSEE